MTTKPKLGGARPGAGRKPTGDEPLTARMELRLTPAEKTKLIALGGAAWVRQQINQAEKGEGGGNG